MKLSKEELIYLLRGVGTEWGSIEDVSRAEHVIDALKTNTLEIEGYERTEWTKFDPNDPKTFPPDDGKNVLGYNPEFSDEPFECFFGIDDNFYCPQDKFRFPLPTHWRPLPMPPQETKAQK